MSDITSFGKFTRYSLPDDHELKFLEDRGAKFWRSDIHGDWYAFVKQRQALDDADQWTYATVSDEGIVEAVEHEIDRVSPGGNREVIAFPRVTDDLWNYRGRKRINRETGALEDMPVEDTSITSISDRQFFHGLSLWGLIPQDEAMMAVQSGYIPTRMQDLITQAEANNQFPAGMTRFDIEIIIAGATSYEFDHPISAMIGQAFGWTEAQRREFWDFAAGL